MPGCLVPQEDRLIDDVPPTFVNRAPRVLDEAAQPGRLTLLDTGSPCVLTFQAPIEDLDTDERGLRVRWFVDWSESNPAPFREDSVPPLLGAVRNRAVDLTLNLDSPGNPLRLVGEHVVELMIADGEIIGREAQQTPGPDGGIINPKYSDIHAWFVSVKSINCTP
jgi:hypothetical protein